MEHKEKEWVDFVVTARKYKTTLTAKYKNRKVWQKPFVGDVISRLPGTIVQLEVAVGQEVKAGQLLLIHQAMKMYNRVVAPVAGKVVEVNVVEGDQIPKDHLMVKIEPR
ncbi:MAG: acetyl-CoA carboxylase biotin carboxyl carrier protein subunit [Parabacteroides distasonis]|nr:acetyl-CoA carboxylase biotin carboxyl carrier protein subunit [Parabacteroides distasonis]MBQ4161710.1 acetyl-CoA carboxylase biotin carboxyl carrier protein subunit [Parabacteroides sp.]